MFYNISSCYQLSCINFHRSNIEIHLWFSNTQKQIKRSWAWSLALSYITTILSHTWSILYTLLIESIDVFSINMIEFHLIVNNICRYDKLRVCVYINKSNILYNLISLNILWYFFMFLYISFSNFWFLERIWSREKI